MKIIFICTSGKDRSPALVEYFKTVMPENEYRCAGVNKYFTSKKGTHYLTLDDIAWATLIVYAEQIHYIVADRDFNGAVKPSLVLALGEYKQGQIGEDYLMAAEHKVKNYLSCL